jgi:hypothetical protein
MNEAGLIELHSIAHERLDLLMVHIATLPDELWHQPIPGFGHPSIWKQLVHILGCEQGGIHDLQGYLLRIGTQKTARWYIPFSIDKRRRGSSFCSFWSTYRHPVDRSDAH